LVPELTVFSARADEDCTTFVGGIADALAYLPLGIIDLVVDWKTDVTPTDQQIDLYRAQIRDYLVATGASEGLLVFVTTGQLVRVHRPSSPLLTRLSSCSLHRLDNGEARINLAAPVPR